MLKQFNERAFLIRALVFVFLIQFGTVGYQTFSCQKAAQNSKESETVSLICNNAASSFNETGKLALATFLALLVPASSPSTNAEVTSSRKRKTSAKEEETPLAEL
jgi:hypothetical protein